MAIFRGKLIEHVKIKRYRAKKGETAVNLMIALADEMVELKKKMNELVDEVNKMKMVVGD